VNKALLTLSILLISPVLSISWLYALDLPDDAFVLLAEAAAETCSICAENKVKKACEIMDAFFVPGTVIQIDEQCHLIKPATGKINELSLSCYPFDALAASLAKHEHPPLLVFAFYTPEKRLIGIQESDYTAPPTADLLHDSNPGTSYEGRVRLIPYAYGDGPTYNYFLQTNKLLIHCKVEHIRPVLHK